jgi:LysM repeat protein
MCSLKGSGAMNTQHNQQLSAMLTRYKRSLGPIAFALVLLALIAAGLHAGDNLPPTESGPAAVVIVQPGDTLWGIAIAYGPAGADPRATVTQIRRANDIAGSLIHPGDTLRVPRGNGRGW